MLDRADIPAWIAQRAEKDDRLYEQYGKSLDSEHTGELIAISDDGRTILGSDELDVALQAVEQFGSGNFSLRRIGYGYEICWRRP